MQFSGNSGVKEMIKILFVREVDSDCCCSIFKQVVSSPLPVGAHRLNLANKKSSPTLSLPNLSASAVETVICRQNSQLYGVIIVSSIKFKKKVFQSL